MHLVLSPEAVTALLTPARAAAIDLFSQSQSPLFAQPAVRFVLPAGEGNRVYAVERIPRHMAIRHAPLDLLDAYTPLTFPYDLRVLALAVTHEGAVTQQVGGTPIEIALVARLNAQTHYPIVSCGMGSRLLAAKVAA